MDFFKRRTRPADGSTASPTSREKHNRRSVMSSSERRHQNNGAHYNEGGLNKRPSFGQWLKVTWPDVLTMIVMGIIGLGVSVAQRHSERPPADFIAGLRSPTSTFA